MSRLLLPKYSNDQNIEATSVFCICCLERNEPYINLLTCTHSDFLNSFEKPEVKPFYQVICCLCHELLKKIKLFKLQVEQSFKLLNNQHIKTIQINNPMPSKHRLRNLKLDLRLVDINIPDNGTTQTKSERQNKFQNIIPTKESGLKKVFDGNQSYEEVMAPETASIKSETESLTEFAHNQQINPNTATFDTENSFTAIFSENLSHNNVTYGDTTVVKNENEFQIPIIHDDMCSDSNSSNVYTNDKLISPKMEIEYEDTVLTTNFVCENTHNLNDDLSMAENRNDYKKTLINENSIKKTQTKTLGNSENEIKTIKNIEKALQIINKNANDNCVNLLASSIQALASSSNLTKITEFLKSKYMTNSNNVVNKSDNEESVDEETESPEEDMENEEVFKDSDSSETISEIKKKIRKLRLTEKQLAEERAEIAKSSSYLACPYQCSSCLIGFHYKENLDDHKKRKHSSTVNGQVCEVCLQIVPRAGFSNHLSIHYMRYKCLSCESRFSSLPDAILHYKKEHCTSLQCDKCEFTGQTRNNLMQHKLKEHPLKRRVTCKKCLVTFENRYLLKKHKNCNKKLVKNSGFKKSGQELSRSSDTDIPMRPGCSGTGQNILHNDPTAVKTYTCQFCSKVFNQELNLRIHMMGVHKM